MSILDSFVAGPYTVALTTAVIVGLTLAIYAGRAAGFSSLAWRVLLVAAVTGGFIGSKFIFLDFHAPRLGEKSNLGALIGGIAIVVLLAPWLRIGVQRALDAMSAPTLVAMAIGRVGCFLAGCCAGTHTALPWGVHVDGDAEAIHPVQLYETFADLLLAAALARWVPLGKPGRRVGIAVMSYAGIRFATEFVRAGRTSVFGLNPVQWSVLAIGLAVAAWLWLRERGREGGTSGVPERAGTVILPAEPRAFRAALIVMGMLLAITIGLPATFTPFERLFLMTAASAIGGYAVLSRAPRWFTLPWVPSLGALFFLNTPADSVPRKREIIVGGGAWTGVYSTLVGQRVTEQVGESCGGTYTYSDVEPAYAHRRSTTGWFSAGLRQRSKSGTRVTVEGQLLTGKDELQSLDPGTLDAPVASSVSILAGGATVTVEGKSEHLRVNLLGGTLSDAGKKSQGVTGSVTARAGVADGFFLEGNLAPMQWYANTGDFWYAGVGYVLNKEGARMLLGGGGGALVSFHIPAGNFELDFSGRVPAATSDIKSPGPNLTVGVKAVIPTR